MRYSCSTRLDWEYQTRRKFNRLTFALFLLVGLTTVLLASFIWMAATSDPFIKSLYWAIQTTTAVGYGMNFDKWNWLEHGLCIVWMLTSAVYWASLLTVVTARVSEFFEK